MKQINRIITEQYPFQLTPEPLESGRGFLLRIAKDLGYNPAGIYYLAGVSVKGVTNSNAIRKLAEYLRIGDPANLQNILYPILEGKGNAQTRIFLGHNISALDLSAREPKVCPKCLAEKRVCPAIWDLQYVVCCPQHNCMLLERCPHCNRKLSWSRKDIHICWCGHDLSKADSPSAPPAILPLTSMLYLQAGYSINENLISAARFPEQTQKLDLQNLLRLIRFIGIRFSAFRAQQAKNYVKKVSGGSVLGVLEETSRALSEWPNGYKNLLREQQGRQFEEDVQSRSISNTFGTYYKELYGSSYGPEFQFLRDEFEKYLAEYWDGVVRRKPSRFNNQDKKTFNWMTPDQVRHALSLPTKRDTVIKMVREGLLAGISIPGRQGKQEFLISRDSFEALYLEHKDWLPTNIALDYLGVTRKSLQALGDAGLLKYRRSHLVGMKRGYVYNRKDAERIFKKFEELEVPIVEYNVKTGMLKVESLLRAIIGRDEGLPQIVKGVIDGTLMPVGRLGLNNGIFDYVFKKSDIVALRRNLNAVDRKGYLTSDEVVERLSIHRSYLAALVKHKYLVSAKRQTSHEQRLFSEGAVKKFHEKYICVTRLAKELGVKVVHLNKKLTAVGIKGIKLKTSQEGHTMFYERNDIVNFSF